jgi:hypothetical protein
MDTPVLVLQMLTISPMEDIKRSEEQNITKATTTASAVALAIHCQSLRQCAQACCMCPNPEV